MAMTIERTQPAAFLGLSFFAPCRTRPGWTKTIRYGTSTADRRRRHQQPIEHFFCRVGRYCPRNRFVRPGATERAYEAVSPLCPHPRSSPGGFWGAHRDDRVIDALEPVEQPEYDGHGCRGRRCGGGNRGTPPRCARRDATGRVPHEGAASSSRKAVSKGHTNASRSGPSARHHRRNARTSICRSPVRINAVAPLNRPTLKAVQPLRRRTAGIAPPDGPPMLPQAGGC